jgi:hypothetical protein
MTEGNEAREQIDQEVDEAAMAGMLESFRCFELIDNGPSLAWSPRQTVGMLFGFMHVQRTYDTVVCQPLALSSSPTIGSM